MAWDALLVFLQMFLTLLSMPFKFCRCFTEQISSPVFQCVACDTVHLIQQHDSMKSPSLLCLVFPSTRSCQHLRFRQFRGLCNCNMNFIKNCLFIFLSCSFEAFWLEVQSVSALQPPVNMWLCQDIHVVASVSFLCELLCTSP